MQRITTTGRVVDKFGPGKDGIQDGNPATDQPPTIIDAGWLERIQEFAARIVEESGLELDAGDHDQGVVAVRRLGAYDLSFIAGWAANGTPADLAVQMVGTLIMVRSARIVGMAAALATAPTGAALIVDVRKNGATIFSTLPQAAIAATLISGGVIAGGHVDLAVNDVLTVHVTQIGSANKGQGLRLGLKGHPL